MIALAYAIPLGVFAGWSGVLDLILTPVHVSQVSTCVCICCRNFCLFSINNCDMFLVLASRVGKMLPQSLLQIRFLWDR